MRVNTLAISDGVAKAVIVPELGAGLASYDLLVGGRREPLFRPCRDLSAARPFDLAHNILVPWSGRISGDGFTFDGRFHALGPNLPGEPLPIHGNGFSSAWSLAEVSSDRARLTFASSGPGPYRYDAEVTYALKVGALLIDLAVTSRAAIPLPYGLGLHPWFPRTPGTTLQARAITATLEDNRHLPAGQVPIALRSEWDFGTPKHLPGAWVNNDFGPWDGHAVIRWKDRGLSLAVEARRGSALTTFILYSPAFDADFFCFEPVTHPVDAHNRVGGPAAHGLSVLSSGETLAVGCRFVPGWLVPTRTGG